MLVKDVNLQQQRQLNGLNTHKHTHNHTITHSHTHT